MSGQQDLFNEAKSSDSSIDTVIKSLYERGQSRNVSPLEAGKIAAEIDQETGEIGWMIKKMVEQLDTVL